MGRPLAEALRALAGPDSPYEQHCAVGMVDRSHHTYIAAPNSLGADDHG
jgi:hypothetical protein